MQLKTILNRIQKFKSFVYGNVVWLDSDKNLALLVEVVARAYSKPICSGCGCRGPSQGTLEPGMVEFVPLWNIAVFFVYALRRVDCKACGVRVKSVPWGEAKNTLTRTYMQFLATQAKRLSWKEVTVAFRTTWDKIFRSVEWAVQRGLAHRDLSNVRAIGVDEVLRQKGHKYLTVVYQIDTECKRLLSVGKHRAIKTLLRSCRTFGKQHSAQLRFACSNVWKPYLKVIAKKAGQVIHVLDGFHIAMHMNEAMDDLRRKEARELTAKGMAPILTHPRRCLLKRPENLMAKQEVKLSDLLRYDLRAVRSYWLNEDFPLFSDYISPYCAGERLEHCCNRVMRSRIEPMKKAVRMLCSHRQLVINWSRASKTISIRVVQGFNDRLKLTTT